jgi:uncharacterized membrane protein
MILSLEPFYKLGGFFLVLVGLRIFGRGQTLRQWGSALFWICLGVILAIGQLMNPALVGGLVVLLVCLAASGCVRAGEQKEEAVQVTNLGTKLLLPALAIPFFGVVGSLTLTRFKVLGLPFTDAGQAPLVALSIGSLIALIWSIYMTGASIKQPVVQGARILEVVGYAIILPQLLAALGVIFTHAGVGQVIAHLVAQVLPTQIPWVAVTAYCLGMALFTMCMGNAFAAFSVITAGIGLPLVIKGHGGNPAILAAMGMLAGYCGTLVSPMAANFNIIPAVLLELKDRNAIIKAQLPIAIAVFCANLGILLFCVFKY